MTTRYFADLAGNYLGGFSGAEPPPAAVEVPLPPADARMVWDGSTWLDVMGPPPSTVAASSAKLVLDDDGLYDDVEAICLDHPVNAVRIFWESANTWVEDNPYVLAIGTELGLTEAQMHDKFLRAKLKDATT